MHSRVLWRLTFVIVAMSLRVLSAPALGQEPTASSAEWITFVSHRSGHNLLYKMRPDGTELKPFFGGEIRNMPSVKEGVTLYLVPHWTRLSPNRRYFASWVYSKGEPYDKWQGALQAMLTVGDVTGKWTRILNAECHEEFAWSRDSKRIAFSVFSGTAKRGTLLPALRSAQIKICGFDGSDETVVLEQPGILVVLDWSPDGKRLLLSRRYFDSKPTRSADLFELELSSKECFPYLIEGTRHVDVAFARYSPDGNKIAVMYTDQDKMYAPNQLATTELDKGHMMRLLAKLALIDRDGTNMRNIADYRDGMRGPMCWSPNAEQILVCRYLPKDDRREKFESEHGLAIWAVRTDGEGDRFITTGWSPDWR